MSEYKRLTKPKNITEYCSTVECEEHCEDCYVENLYERLAELENKIEDGSLRFMPCKVGDKVYCIYHFYDCEEDFEYDIIPEEVVDIIVQEDDFDIGTACQMIGKFKRLYVCLTKTEAENKLEELKNFSKK